eukprot:5495478-Prymnesium_polylepis.1
MISRPLALATSYIARISECVAPPSTNTISRRPLAGTVPAAAAACGRVTGKGTANDEPRA